MHNKVIGVVRGGPSNEYEVSLKTGAAILTALRHPSNEMYKPVDILIDKDGKWHIDGIEVDPHHAVSKVNLIWNALHGSYGEDGKIQSLLESLSVPFTGSGSVGSSIGMNKSLAKKIFESQGIKTPYWKEFESEKVKKHAANISKELFHSFILPAVVKPSNSGSSLGVTIVHVYKDLESAMLEAANHGDVVIVEEYIKGIESTCGVIEGFRGHELYSLPPVEIRPKAHFFDYHSKYSGQSEEIVPATFDAKTKALIEETAKKIHKALGLRHYSRSDFMIHPRKGVYALEVNTLPGMTSESLLTKALAAVGSDIPEFVRHIIEIAIQ